MSEETYLGDGLYARFDRFGMLILRAPREGGDHWVGLDPEVIEALVKYIDARTDAQISAGMKALKEGGEL